MWVSRGGGHMLSTATEKGVVGTNKQEIPPEPEAKLLWGWASSERGCTEEVVVSLPALTPHFKQHSKNFTNKKIRNTLVIWLECQAVLTCLPRNPRIIKRSHSTGKCLMKNLYLYKHLLPIPAPYPLKGISSCQSNVYLSVIWLRLYGPKTDMKT